MLHRALRITSLSAALAFGLTFAAAGMAASPDPASPNATHSCLVQSGFHVTYLTAEASAGALGDLQMYFSADDHAWLTFEPSPAKAQKDVPIANEEAHILNLYAGGYAIRNVMVTWDHKPSGAQKQAVQACIKP